MNSKTHKQIRRAVRRFFSHFPVRALADAPDNVRLVPDFERGLNPDGTVRMKPFFYTGTLVNKAESQRGAIRSLKKMSRVSLFGTP